MNNKVYAFEVSVKGMPWKDTVNARTRGQAKSEHWTSVKDAWSDIPFTAVRARKIGPPQTSDRFTHNATYRGFPGLKCGQRVKVGEATGTIVGHNSCANFEVLFDADSVKYANMKLSVHPDGVELI